MDPPVAPASPVSRVIPISPGSSVSPERPAAASNRRTNPPAEGVDPGKPSRNRRRDKTDVKLADLLAEALVAYQSSNSDVPEEDVLSAYDDIAASSGQPSQDPAVDDTGRHRFPDRAPQQGDTRY